MTEFAFFAGKEDRWGNDMMALCGNLNICPCLTYLELLYHTSGELLSISHLKIWGDIQEPCNDMAYLLVHTGDALGAKSYGMALVWISPHQVRASTMEEAVGTLSACISSGPNWLYVLAQLYEGSNHTPLPKGKHLGILPQGKAEESPYGQISQLKVCQLLSAGPQVIYLVGLNGGNQPVIINLPEPLHSSSSITTDKHPHMRIDIPLLSPEESEHATLTLGRAHAIPAATTPKTPWKPRISLMAEVNDLLKWGMVDNSSHESEHSTAGKVAAAEAVMSLSHKAEVPAPPVDTSSKANVEEGEACLESNPVNVSPTMAVYSSHSGSPMVDLMELQMDANLATNHMLSVKRSTDLKRQQVIWELGVLLHWNKAKEAVANEKAKLLHSWEVLDAKVGCTKVVLEAKYNYRVTIQEAKMIRGNWLQESEIAYSKALGKNATMRSSQSATLHREHVRLMQELEEQAIREESKSCHNFLSACQAILHHALQPLKENLTTSYHILLGWSPSSPPSAPLTRTPLAEEQPSTFPKAMQEGPSSSKRWETPIWFASLKPSHAEAFSQDSDIMKEARLHFFSNHSCNWVTDGTNDPSNVFRELAESASLLGEAIYEIQLSCTGPEELKQASYASWSLPKGPRFPRAVPTMESPKVMGLMGIHDPNALWHYTGHTHCPWCRKEGQNEGTVVNHLRTTHYRLGLVCDWCFGCPTVTLESLCWHGCQNCQRYCIASGSGLSNWPTYPTRSLHKGAKVVLLNQTPFPPEGQKVQQRRHCSPAHWIHLLFSSLTDKQLFLFQLWPGLPKKDITDYS